MLKKLSQSSLENSLFVKFVRVMTRGHHNLYSSMKHKVSLTLIVTLFPLIIKAYVLVELELKKTCGTFSRLVDDLFIFCGLKSHDLKEVFSRIMKVANMTRTLISNKFSMKNLRRKITSIYFKIINQKMKFTYKLKQDIAGHGYLAQLIKKKQFQHRSSHKLECIACGPGTIG